VDIPVTLLVAHGEAVPRRSLRSLARRLADKLGHAAEGCLLDGPTDTLEAAVEASLGRDASRFVVLPLALGPADTVDRQVDRAIESVLRRWPRLRVHRGAPPGTDDVARMLGDRAREAKGRCPAGDAVVVIVGGGDANPTANAELAGLARLVYEAHRFRDVGYAFLDLTAPSVGEVVGRWARLGAELVVVVPYVVFAGRRYRRLVAQAAGAAKASRVAVAVARPLASHPAFVWALVRRHLEALQDASAGEGGETPYIDPALLRVLRGAHSHDVGPLAALEARMSAMLPPRYRDPDVTVSSAPMDAAGLQLGPDGTVAWERTWQGYCELALAGGPPHRGTLLEPAPREDVLADPARYAEVMCELGRGIRAITGLDVVADGPPGWIGVVCASEAMAIWLMRAIVVENVMARREGTTLYLPASPRFTLGGEIKNVVTVVAKTHHYWVQHAREGRPDG
jgi:sirohydrochlorin cobaltochelatase